MIPTTEQILASALDLIEAIIEQAPEDDTTAKAVHKILNDPDVVNAMVVAFESIPEGFRLEIN